MSLEEPGAVRRCLEPEVPKRRRRRDATARRAHDQALLQQVRLVDVLDRVLLLADRNRERREADRAAAELRADRPEDVAVEAIEAALVDLEQIQRLGGDPGVDVAAAADLGEVSHALEQPVGHARRAARARGERLGPGGVDLHAEDARRAADDLPELGRVVQVEPWRDPEAVAQRRREQPGARRGPDQRERREVEVDDPRPRPLADGDRQLAVLHRRIEGLLQRAREAVDLVHEEHRARLERGQVRGDVALALERRRSGRDELDAELVRDDLGKRGLPESRRPGEQDVVEGLLAGTGGLDEDLELLLDRVLTDEVGEPLRAQRAIELVLGGNRLGRLQALDPGLRIPPLTGPPSGRGRSAPRRSRRRRRRAARRPPAGCSRGRPSPRGRSRADRRTCAGRRSPRRPAPRPSRAARR